MIKRPTGFVRGHAGQHTGSHENEHAGTHSGDTGITLCPIPSIILDAELYAPAPGVVDAYCASADIQYCTGREQIKVSGVAPRYTLDGTPATVASPAYTVPVWRIAAIPEVRAISNCGPGAVSAERALVL